MSMSRWFWNLFKNLTIHLFNRSRFCQRQRESKDGAAARLVSRPDAAAVVFDDFFADGKAQAGAVFFAKGREGFEKCAGNFGRNPGASVFDLGNQFIFFGEETDEDFS